MQININEKFISIPPHISATWNQISFLQTTENESDKTPILVIHLMDGNVVNIPNLDTKIISDAFSAHIKHLESKVEVPASKGQTSNNDFVKAFGGILQQITGLSPDQISNMPIKIGFSTKGLPGIENIEQALQHDLSQSRSENLSPEMLEKLASMVKMMLGGDLGGFPKPEPHCNCTHCQLARTIHKSKETEEPVSEEDLKFRSWNIEDNGKDMYTVTNPCDDGEHYTVFLGNPIGCTCGQNDCEHIKAVLYS